MHPRSGHIFNPLVSMYPLMKNWNDSKALEREMYDVRNGHSHGDVSSFFNIITYLFHLVIN